MYLTCTTVLYNEYMLLDKQLTLLDTVHQIVSGHCKTMNEQQTFIDNLPIRLGQFLKLANLVADGFEAKIRIQHGEIMVNGIVETQRGKQLQEGDQVTFAGTQYRLIKKQSNYSPTGT